MLPIYEESIIISMIEAFFPSWSPENMVLTMCLKFEWKHYDEDPDKELEFRKRFLLVIHRPHNYTKVLLHEVKDNEHFLFNEGNTIDFNLESDHDSCWRSDGFRFVFETWLEAEQYFEKNGYDIRNIQDISCHCGFDMFGGRMAVRQAKLTPVHDEEYKKYGRARNYTIEFGEKMKLVPVPITEDK